MRHRKLTNITVGFVFLLANASGAADENLPEEKSIGYQLGVAIGENVMKAVAEGIDEERKRCTSLPGEAATTRCLNNALRQLGMETTAEVHGLWVTVLLDDDMTDQKNGVSSVEADPEADSAKLTIRCLRGNVDLFVAWPSTMKMPPASEPISLRIRLDSEEPKITDWRMADVSPNVTFYKGDAIELANQLTQGEKFVIEPASSDGTGVQVFDIREAEASFDKLREPCNW